MKFFKPYIHRDINNHPKAQLMLLGGVLFSLGLVTSITSTYAWFQINPLLSIQNLNVRITCETDYELTVELERESDKQRITMSDPNHLDSDGNFTGYTLKDMGFDSEKHRLHDVSGMFYEDWHDNADPSKDLPTFRSSYGAAPGSVEHYTKSDLASAEKYGETGKGYLQAVFYLKANEECDVYLTPNSSIKSADNEKTAPGKRKENDTRTDNEILKDLRKVTNTVRFSFYSADKYVVLRQPKYFYDDSLGDPYHEHEYLDYQTYYGGILDMNGDGYFDSIDGHEVLYGQYDLDGEIPYLDSKPADPTPVNGKKEVEFNTFTAKHLDGVEWVDISQAKESLNIAQEPAESIFEYIFDSKKPYRPLKSICHLQKNEEKRLVFSVYCEGWDENMTDLVDEASFNIELGFAALIKD